jgi:hypothetical protein
MRAPRDEGFPSLKNSPVIQLRFNALDDRSDHLVVVTFQVLALRLGPRSDEKNRSVDR